VCPFQATDGRFASRSWMAGAFPCSHGFTVYVVSGWSFTVLSSVFKVPMPTASKQAMEREGIRPIARLDDGPAHGPLRGTQGVGRLSLRLAEERPSRYEPGETDGGQCD